MRKIIIWCLYEEVMATVRFFKKNLKWQNYLNNALISLKKTTEYLKKTILI